MTGMKNAQTPGSAPPLVHQVLGSSANPLDRESRAYFEPRFGQDLSQVRLHTGEPAARSARAVGALAYAAGEHIVLGAGYSHGSSAGRHLLGHELAHVVQQREGADSATTLARAPDKHQHGSSRSESLAELHDILVKLLKSLDRKTQLCVMGFKTIALGLVEATDETGSAFQTLVYTASGNWGSADLEAKAAALGIFRGNPRARGEGRGANGAPEDAEQLMIEDADQQGSDLLGMAVSRKPCCDCTDALLDESVQTVFVDPAKHLPKRQRASRVKPSAALETARAAIEAVFSPQISAPGAIRDDLGPKASLWSALNGLDIKELYKVFEEISVDRRATIERKAVKAEGIGEQRILAVLDVLDLKRENLKEHPDALKQAMVNSLVEGRLALIPDDQAAYLRKQLYPSLRLAPKPAVPAPKKSAPKKKTDGPSEQNKSAKDAAKDKTDAKPTNSYLAPLVKALAALGVAAATVEAATDFLLVVASDIFTNVVLRGIVNELKVPVREAIKESVEETIKHVGPKARVLTDEVLHKLPEKAAEELGDAVEKITHAHVR
jgi:hypothetical protein